MRILVLQFTPATRGRPVPRFEPQLGTLLALLEQRGHELALAGFTRFDEPRLKAALARSLPQLIYADVAAVCADAARRTCEYIERHEFLPIVAGGQYPTVEPAACLSLPAVRAVAIGEPDASLVTYLERVKDPAAGQVVSGVWLRDEQGLAKPALPPLVEDLDSLPRPNRELFGYAEYVRQSGEIEVATGRGCPQRCAYCVNPYVRNLYAGRELWVRRRGPAKILAEIAALRQRYAGVQVVRFLDHSFALDREWLDDFLTQYRRACELPFRCHLRANSAYEGVVTRLADAGCRLVDVELISSSNLIRNEIFEMGLAGEQIRDLFARLHAAGVAARVIVYLGAPYESEAALDETRALLTSLRPALVDVRPYYPWPGTAAREVCREHGWLHPRGEDQYHEDRPGIDIPACRPDTVTAFIRRLRSELGAAGDTPWWRRWSAAWEQVFQRRRL